MEVVSSITLISEVELWTFEIAHEGKAQAGRVSAPDGVAIGAYSQQQQAGVKCAPWPALMKSHAQIDTNNLRNQHHFLTCLPTADLIVNHNGKTSFTSYLVIAVGLQTEKCGH